MHTHIQIHACSLTHKQHTYIFHKDSEELHDSEGKTYIHHNLCRLQREGERDKKKNKDTQLSEWQLIENSIVAYYSPSSEIYDGHDDVSHTQ